MKLEKTRLHILHEREDLSSKVKSGVSLHCHTEHSKEMLDFVPHYASKLPIISFFWDREQRLFLEREGRPIDFSTAYWSPPLNPLDVYNIEKKQLNDAGLEAIVSITDHDEIKGNLRITADTDVSIAPISLEWTVPFLYGFFHLGIHNLPAERADDLTRELLSYTYSDGEAPDDEHLRQLFEMLNNIPDVLIVLNHPIWDIEIVGEKLHMKLLKKFLNKHGKWLHALEINGFRSWSENKRVIEMAEALGFPVATGGDRHGCKPNTVINLTNKSNFSEFVEEMRVDKRSEIVLMPEYKLPLHSRQLQSFSEILSKYPDFAEDRRRWFDRVFYDTGDGQGTIRLSEHGWERGGPRWLRVAVWTLGFLGSSHVRPMFRLTERKKDRVPMDIRRTKFEMPDVREITVGFQGTPRSTGTAG